MNFIEKILKDDKFYELWLKRFIIGLVGVLIYYFIFRAALSLLNL